MKIFLVTTDNKRLFVIASGIREAEEMAVDEYYRHVLDDDLADLMDVQYIAETEEEAGIFEEVEKKTFKEKYQEVRGKI